MPDDLVERLRKVADLLEARVNVPIWFYATTREAADRITALEQATPEEVVETAYQAFKTSDLADLPDNGSAWDTKQLLTHHLIAVISAIAAPLRAQGAAAEREKCAKIADGFGANLTGLDALRIAARIRAGGSGG